MKKTYQAFYIDQITGIKKIMHRCTTEKTIDEWLMSYGKRCGFYQYNHETGKFELANGYIVEEV